MPPLETQKLKTRANKKILKFQNPNIDVAHIYKDPKIQRNKINKKTYT